MHYKFTGQRTKPSKSEEFEAVLQSPKEEDTQRFLKENMEIFKKVFPYETVGENFGYYVVPKFKFGDEYISDFLIVSMSDQAPHVQICLIELEPPTSNIFNSKGNYSERLNGAINQVNDWLAWIRKYPKNFINRVYERHCDCAGKENVPLDYRNLYAPNQLLIDRKIIIGRYKMLNDKFQEKLTTLYADSNKTLQILTYDVLLIMFGIEKRVEGKNDNGFYDISC